jgi:hypothetical protein
VDKIETIHSEENMVTRQLKEFQHEAISQPPDELYYDSLYCKIQETSVVTSVIPNVNKFVNGNAEYN